MGARCRAPSSRAAPREQKKSERGTHRARGLTEVFRSASLSERRAARRSHRSEKDEIKLRLMTMIAVMMAISVMRIIRRTQINCHRRTNYVRRMFSMLTDSRRRGTALRRRAEMRPDRPPRRQGSGPFIAKTNNKLAHNINCSGAYDSRTNVWPI